MDKYERRRLRLLSLKQEKCNDSNADLARKIGRDPSYVARMLYPAGKPGMKRIADDMMEVIETAFGLTRGYFDLEPEPINENGVPPLGASVGVSEEAGPSSNPDSYIWIDHYEVRLSAGNGNADWVIKEKDPICFRRGWFIRHRLVPEYCKAMYVRGRSMEPALNDWDTVLINTDDAEIVDGDIYAVLYRGNLYIKTLERTAAGLRLKSENTSFDSIDIAEADHDSLKVLGKKVWRAG